MDIAMIGLGKMGANMVQKLMNGGHRVVAYDVSQKSESFVAKVLAAMRNQFGGHAVKKAE